MATERGGRTNLRRGVGRLGAAVAGALRRIATDRPADDETPPRGGTRPDGSRANLDKGGSTGQLLTPEERVVEVIERAGGSARQAEIVDTVEWSESTVSRTLSDLETREAVTRYQVGREKVVYLPGNEPAAARSALAPAD